jgi:hypothetical protein
VRAAPRTPRASGAEQPHGWLARGRHGEGANWTGAPQPGKGIRCTLLDLPRSSVRKHTVNHMPTSSSGRARNKGSPTACALSEFTVRGWVQHIYGAIQEFGGFEEPGWLD